MHERVSVAIIGAGPAGIAAAIFLKRAGLEPLLLEEREPGGLLREANFVENYPGFPGGIVGRDLADLMVQQMQELGVRLESGSAKRVSLKGRSFVVETGERTYESDAVIVATGTSPKRIDVEGAMGLEGRRLFYRLSSLGADAVKGRRSTVLGGGDAAFDYAINLSERGSSSIRIVARSTGSCLPLLQERARARGIEIIEGCAVIRMMGSNVGVRIECVCGDDEKVLESDLVVVAHGREPRLESLAPELRDSIRDPAERPPLTEVEGLFFAGDVVRGIHRQAAVAAGDGVLAAMHVEKLLKKRRGAEG
jgi:thioredoxin reductase (NADPH)